MHKKESFIFISNAFIFIHIWRTVSHTGNSCLSDYRKHLVWIWIWESLSITSPPETHRCLERLPQPLNRLGTGTSRPVWVLWHCSCLVSAHTCTATHADSQAMWGKPQRKEKAPTPKWGQSVKDSQRSHSHQSFQVSWFSFIVSTTFLYI